MTEFTELSLPKMKGVREGSEVSPPLGGVKRSAPSPHAPAAELNVTEQNECEEIFKECRRRGVTLFIEAGDLGYKPKARMSRGLLYRIKQHKESVVQLLESSELVDDSPQNNEAERDQILRNAMTHLSKQGVPYTPLDVEEDIQASYEADTLEGFRKTVRGWMRELVRAQRGAA